LQKLDLIKWDDFRLVLEIAQARSLTKAAKQQGKTISTLTRRLDTLEEQLNVKLFTRLRGNYQLTEPGKTIYETAMTMEADYIASLRRLSGQDQVISGHLRITSTEVICDYFLAPILPEFCARYPAVTIELVTNNVTLDLARREADLSLRPQPPSEGGLVGRKLGNLPWRFFMSKQLLNSAQAQERDLTAYSHADRWLKFYPLYLWAGNSSAQGISSQLQHTFPQAHSAISSSSLLTLKQLCLSSESLIYVPRILGAASDQLVVVPDTKMHIAGELWAVCHQDLRQNAKLQQFLNFLSDKAESTTLL